jgi:TFIIE beta subunit core domain.
MSGSSQYKFGVLAKIVKYMRSRHQEGDDHPLSLDEILDETNQLDVGSKVKQVSAKHSERFMHLSSSEVFNAWKGSTELYHFASRCHVILENSL